MMKSILDPSFRYVNSSSTDVRKTFARIRRQQRAVDEHAVHAGATPSPIVLLDAHRKSAA